MQDAAIDACCLIDLLASGHAEAILLASGFTWQLPSAVQDEVLYRRQHDPAQPGKTINVPVDLSGIIASGPADSLQSSKPKGVAPVYALRGDLPLGRRGDASGRRRRTQVGCRH